VVLDLIHPGSFNGSYGRLCLDKFRRSYWLSYRRVCRINLPSNCPRYPQQRPFRTTIDRFLPLSWCCHRWKWWYLVASVHLGFSLFKFWYLQTYHEIHKFHFLLTDKISGEVLLTWLLAERVLRTWLLAERLFPWAYPPPHQEIKWNSADNCMTFHQSLTMTTLGYRQASSAGVFHKQSL